MNEQELRKIILDMIDTPVLYSQGASAVAASIISLINAEKAKALRELGIEIKAYMFPMKEVREVYCPKENRRIKDYFSHHDLDHFCEDCGTRLKERMVQERAWEQEPEDYEVEQFIDAAVERMAGKIGPIS